MASPARPLRAPERARLESLALPELALLRGWERLRSAALLELWLLELWLLELWLLELWLLELTLLELAAPLELALLRAREPARASPEAAAAASRPAACRAPRRARVSFSFA